jgi:hypothetical protein
MSKANRRPRPTAVAAPPATGPGGAAVGRKPSLYFVNGWVDYALIGGVSLLTFFLLKIFHHARTEVVWTTAAALAWVVNWPHFSATNYRLYQSKANIRQYPIVALVVPLVVLTATVGSFASPGGVAPWLVKLFLFWSPYHFSGQTVGITLIYARRAGFSVGRWERMALSGFVFSTFLVQMAMLEAGQGVTEYYSVPVPLLGIPVWMPQVLRVWMILCGAGLLFFAVRWSVKNKRLLPPIVLLPAVTQLVWFVIGPTVPSFFEFVPFFHSLQYMLIAWLMQLKEKLDQGGLAPSRRYVLSESARWGVVNFAGGALLFYLLPQLASSAGFTLAFASAVVLSGVQIHHFFVDGVIWKLKNPRVSSPLLVNISDLTTRPEPRALHAA